MNQQNMDQSPNPQIKMMNNSDIQIKGLSEYIGRNVLANQVITHTGTTGFEETGLIESSIPLYDIKTQQPLEIEDVVKRRDELLDQKKIEPMTGAYRREELYARHPNGFSADETVLAVDVAGLKLLNDFYGGHKTGDSALKSSVLSIKKLIPDSEIIRMGGDEFVVVSKTKISAELWDAVNQDYLETLSENTGQNLTDKETLLRAGIAESEQNADNVSARPITDEVVATADEAEVKISALLKILGNDADVPRIASLEEIDKWLEDNKIKLVERGDKIVAYQTWNAGKRRALPTFIRKRGSTRVRGRY